MLDSFMEKRGVIDPEITPCVEPETKDAKQASVESLEDCVSKRLTDKATTCCRCCRNTQQK